MACASASERGGGDPCAWAGEGNRGATSKNKARATARVIMSITPMPSEPSSSFRRAPPDRAAVELQRRAIGRIDCALLSVLDPDAARIIDPGARRLPGVV